jgi:alpha-L-rhamnosidase
MRKPNCFQLVLSVCLLTGTAAAQDAGSSGWPAIASEQRPWTYWWWMGSAVDKTNLTRELQRYHDAGLGGVHIIPIYGADGWESNYLSYLSPKWMEMMGWSVAEARRLGMGVDMSTGTGWCFGGPNVSNEDANASVVVKTFKVAAGAKLAETFNAKQVQALVAYSADGKCVELTGRIGGDGRVNWSPTSGDWLVYAVSQKFSGQKVKRAAPGGEGPMLNPFSPAAMKDYLRRFSAAFEGYPGPLPRAQYQDSYEYKSDWSPDFFAQFEKRRGYPLQTELPALFGTNREDHAARVKADYRETVSDLMVEEAVPEWVKWSHDHHFTVRYEAHGSPGNLLDLYALADVPETEMFHTERSRLISKFASSAGHVAGRPLVSAETGTWLREHFTETLGDLKFLADDMFLSGINHIFYHGTCYSPNEAGWPGWHFYASTEMNPRNPIWRDAPALNAYIARCQSVLQSGRPDNDILLYWPVHDFWHNPAGRLTQFKVDATGWFDDQPVGRLAQVLAARGYSFDYVSDRQLAGARTAHGMVEMPGGNYRVIVVPACGHLPLETFQRLLALAKSGALVVFEDHLPADVPGWGRLAERREELKRAEAEDLAALTVQWPAPPKMDFKGQRELNVVKFGRGGVVVGEAIYTLAALGIPREPMADGGQLAFVRRAFAGGHYYFVANQGGHVCEGWVTLGTAARAVTLMDPMTGRTGLGALQPGENGRAQLFLQLQPGESLILKVQENEEPRVPRWDYWREAGEPVPVVGRWSVGFTDGGPVPQDFTTTNLASWTESGDANAQRFAGSAKYSITFDMPKSGATNDILDLGDVRQSARVRVNGGDWNTLIAPPFRLVVPELKREGNRLEVEVTGVAANRIRDLDRRGVPWKTFHDINFVNIDYKPFDASRWPLTECGLLGPVTLTPAEARR